MPRVMLAAALSFTAILLTPDAATPQSLPSVKGKPVVAIVQGQPITLDEFNRELAAMRQEQVAGVQDDKAAQIALLDRMIRVVLIAQEAERMELDKLPGFRNMVDSYARLTLREELAERTTRHVKADPGEVEKVYRDAVREWVISAALFDTEGSASSMRSEVESGQSFGEVAKAYLAQGKATKIEEGLAVKRGALDPAVGQVVEGMTVGSISPVIPVKAGHTVLKLEEVRYPDNPGVRATAEQTILARRRQEAVKALDEELKRKYVRIDHDLLKSVDYEAEVPGLEALLQDRRVLAQIKGEKPLTVGELTAEMKLEFFHGAQLAAQRKRLNAKKEQLLENILHRRVFRKEALRLGLDRTDSYRSKIKEYERSVLFDAFIRKAIVPDIKLSEEEIKAYYEQHAADYAMPEMMRIKSLAFASRESAEFALKALRTGADFQWVADHADGRVDPNAPGVLALDARPIMTSELPDGIQKAVAGASTGDLRLYTSPEKHFYLLAIDQVVASRTQPYDQVRPDIATKIFEMKIQQAVEAYATKLRSLSDVKVYLKPS